jgi:formylglycine-generating enzyme
MNTLDGLLTGIVSEPVEETRWLVLADWLEENDNPRRSELLRMHRKLLSTCCEPEQHPERAQWHARIVELIGEGVRPCVPQMTLLLPGDVHMTFSFIPPGQFRMGSDHEKADLEDEKPVHKVTLTRGFFMGIHQVTQAQWKAVMDTDPSRFKGPNRPVERVSWEECQEFCKKLTSSLKGHATVCLPTETEWEYVCRAGTTTEYHFGDVINTDLANYNGDLSWNGSLKGKYRKRTTTVGFFPSNAWGLFNVHGNVWEWCEDWFAPYSAEDQTDPCRTEVHSDECHVLRGGSWLHDPGFCRAASRGRYAPLRRDDFCEFCGFRVCFHLD